MRVTRRSRKSILALVAVAGLGLVSCDGGGSGTVDVSLQEWAVVPADESASAGEITFALSNDGAETHEFVVIRTDLDPGSLPTGDDGAVLEDGEGMEVVDEVEDLPSGDSAELAVDLEAGNYALICNIVETEDGEVESHYQQGMRIAFTVE
jgi:uncharacterized cupredoxin-like copper-binding protein